MNIVKCTTSKHRKTTESDFQIRRPGQYKVPRVKTRQSSGTPNTNSRVEKSIDHDNSTIRSRLACRSELTQSSNSIRSSIGGIGLPEEIRRVLSETGSGLVERTPPAPSSASKRTVRDERGQTTGSRSFSVSEHDVSKNIENFVANCTPRKLNTLASIPMTPASVPAVSAAGVQKTSRDSSSLAKKTYDSGEITNSVVLVLTEGRGSAQGEIGIAAIDLRRPVLILCQISDTQNYMNTINKINVLNPAEILIPNTFMEQIQGTVMYNLIRSQFPLSTIITASRKHFCENEGRLYLKNAIIPECIPTLEQVYPKLYAVSAAAALLKHIEFNHNVIFSSNTLRIEYEGIDKLMIIDANSAMRLELVSNSSFNTKTTLYDVLNHCITIGGKRRLRSSILQPSSDIQLIHNRQEAVEEMLSIQEQDLILFKNILYRFADVEKLYWLCTKVSKNTKHMSKLQGNYTLLLKTTLEALPILLDILKPFKSEYICNIRKALSNSRYSKMLEIIEITINKESTRSKCFAQSQFQRCFAIKSNLNPLLDVARTIYSELIDDFHGKVNILGVQLGTEHLLVKNTYNRGFHVQVEVTNIPNFDVKHPPSICKRVECVKNTIKFTTEDLLILNVRIGEVLNEVELLTNAMLFEMLKALRKYISCIYDLCNGIDDLDLIFSFVRYSKRSALTRPKFGPFTDVKNSRHPILDFVRSVGAVSNDIYASSDKNLNVITGPNMGGKSIYIRQVALLQIIAQIGCFVPATEARFRICDRLFTRIGFEDSVESNASTWVLEINELNAIIPSLTKHSVVIIDELCRATTLEEGSSLAWAICEHIMQYRAFIFYATHSILITKLRDLYCNVVNYHMEVLPARDSAHGLAYTYKLKPGATDVVDYGLTLARDLKMPEHLIDHAVEIEKSLRHMNMASPYNPCNEADSIADDCVRKLLDMKDDERLDVSGVRSVVSAMMDELIENGMVHVDPSADRVDSDDDEMRWCTGSGAATSDDNRMSTDNSI